MKCSDCGDPVAAPEDKVCESCKAYDAFMRARRPARTQPYGSAKRGDEYRRRALSLVRSCRAYRQRIRLLFSISVAFSLGLVAVTMMLLLLITQKPA